MSRKRYSAEFKAAAVARVAAGEKPSDIQKDLGLSNSMVSKWARELKKHPPKKAKASTAPGKYTPEVKAKALARVRAGESGAAVAREMKIGNGMISYWLKHDKGVAAGAVDVNGHRTNGASHNGHANGNGAVLDAIVFLKKAKKAIRRSAAERPDGLDDPVYLYALLALKVLQGEMVE